MNRPFYCVRHEGPFRLRFEDRDVRLGIGGLTLDIDHFEIRQPQRTWVKDASDPVEREFVDSLAGVMFGHGNVEFSRTQGTIQVDSEEEVIIPNGLFEELTEDEQMKYPASEWKFSFDYTELPTVHPM